jgi:polyhydroxyalkanoate synthesis regulator phasin
MDASRVADAISRAQSAGQEQAASMQQALEAIMAHLETQAASATLKVDVADIMSRLRDLEEQQQSIQSQFSSNRWGPS